ncbi:hypothetical protein K439DRAFT_406114 [Ramaria rubella]|nr:hypothetical protein K439DRAFT_406114 [Ramaria rubella]
MSLTIGPGAAALPPPCAAALPPPRSHPPGPIPATSVTHTPPAAPRHPAPPHPTSCHPHAIRVALLHRTRHPHACRRIAPPTHTRSSSPTHTPTPLATLPRPAPRLATHMAPSAHPCAVAVTHTPPPAFRHTAPPSPASANPHATSIVLPHRACHPYNPRYLSPPSHALFRLVSHPRHPLAPLRRPWHPHPQSSCTHVLRAYLIRTAQAALTMRVQAGRGVGA